ncbi:MAG: PilZ domain-containing protein [Candidatus Omnitrophota bacterium]|nr:PilZ domain-containing protein [Candidatus Omnitrophota bacterium]
MEDTYSGPERREFVRLGCMMPTMLKVCKKEILDKLLEGYTSNISQSGLLCSIKEDVNEGDILWLSFDRSTLHICEALERKSFIYQNGVIGKVIRRVRKEDQNYQIGIQFITREEKDSVRI